MLEFFRQSPDRSPTVNASWFIGNAHLANLYYTQGKCTVALQTCDKALKICNESLGNRWLAERALPMLPSTQWSAVYDAELQTVLGFASLCKFVSERLLRSEAQLGEERPAGKLQVCIAICVVHFLYYLQARCAIAASLLDDAD